MARIISFVVLLVILLVIFGLFFQVMGNFLLPLFLALLLVVIFGPVHGWFKSRCGKHDRVAATLTTATVLLAFFLPASLILLKAAQEGGKMYRQVFPKEIKTQNADAAAAPNEAAADDDSVAESAKKGLDWFTAKIVDLGGQIGVTVDKSDIDKRLRDGIKSYLAPMALSTGQFLLKFAVGVAVMLFALYYFLADGPAMIRAIMRLVPLEDEYKSQLVDQFGNVIRAVVLATLLSALAQGALAGVGFYFAGVESAFLLTVLAMLFAIVPFIGSAGVWIPVCLWIGFVDDRLGPAIVLAVYCGVVVSGVDNVIKPLVLHGRSNIHPLLAFLSVLGGAQALGAIGIIVGPMAVAFLQTLLEMINKEMIAIGKESKQKAVAAKGKA